MKFRFKKEERITQPQDFRKVMKSGRRLTSKNFILFLRESKNPFHRLGVVVKKEVGSAPFRNRIKRYIREFFRHHKEEIEGCFDIVLFIKKGCYFQGYSEVEEELRELFAL